MNILIVGKGGREHAIAWKVAQSPLVNSIWVAPGNAGTALSSQINNIDIEPDDIKALARFAKQNDINLTIVGPEIALAAGITDYFQQQGLACFGPTKQAAQLETSKRFSKDFMQSHDIPTAAYRTFVDLDLAIDYINQHTFPLVIKADGLAAGKGVIIAQDASTAINAATDMLTEQRFGDAGHQIIIEEFLEGDELSFIALSDGQHLLPLASAQDHKKRDEQEQGPNTGGMGAYSPAWHITPELEQQIMTDIMQPTIDQLRLEGSPYVGFIYAGLMVNRANNTLNVLEFNCRLGDPETQPILMRLESDLVSLIMSALNGALNKKQAKWSSKTALSVVMATKNYPEQYQKGHIINGLSRTTGCDDSIVFHSGTKLSDNNSIATDGGRVLTITALGDNIIDAKQRAYELVDGISWQHSFYRSDIGEQAIKHFLKS